MGICQRREALEDSSGRYAQSTSGNDLYSVHRSEVVPPYSHCFDAESHPHQILTAVVKLLSYKQVAFIKTNGIFLEEFQLNP